MNDKMPAATGAAGFDPAAHGWARQETSEFPNLVGPFWLRDEGEGLRIGFVAERKHLNRGGFTHGGMMMTLGDQAMALAARRATGGKRHATIELNMQFVGAVKVGEFVVAHPEVVRVTRSVIFMRATMMVGNRVVAATNGIWKILDEG